MPAFMMTNPLCSMSPSLRSVGVVLHSEALPLAVDVAQTQVDVCADALH